MFGLFEMTPQKIARKFMSNFDAYLSQVIKHPDAIDSFFTTISYKNEIEDWMGTAILCHIRCVMMFGDDKIGKEIWSFVQKDLSANIAKSFENCENFKSSFPESMILEHVHRVSERNDMVHFEILHAHKCTDWFCTRYNKLLNDNAKVEKIYKILNRTILAARNDFGKLSLFYLDEQLKRH